MRLHLHRGDLEGALDTSLADRAPSPVRSDLHWLPCLHRRLEHRLHQRSYADSLLIVAEAELALMDSGVPEPWLAGFHMDRGYALAQLGHPEAAVRAGRRTIEHWSASRDAMAAAGGQVRGAWVLTEAGYHDEAVETLDQALSIPPPLSVHDLRLDPRWDPLRDHPRLQALLEEHG